MLCLENPDNVCYANDGTNALLSSPCVTRFLFSLPNNKAQFNTIQQLARFEDNKLTSLTELQGIVTLYGNSYFNKDNRMSVSGFKAY